MFTHILQNQNKPLSLEDWRKQLNLSNVLAGASRKFLENETGRIILQQYVGRDFKIVVGSIQNLQATWTSFLPHQTGSIFFASLKNAARLKTSLLTHLIKPGFSLFIPKKHENFQLHIKKGEEYKFMLININQDLIESLQSEYLERIPREPQKMLETLSRITLSLLDASYHEDVLHFYYENRVRELLFELRNGRNLPIQDASFTRSEVNIIHSVDSQMKFSPAEHRSLHEMSLQTGMTKYKLKEGFKQLYGMGLFERLLHWRIEMACKLLIDTNKPVKEIAAAAGYKRLTSFITIFRKKVGTTPGEYRQKRSSAKSTK